MKDFKSVVFLFFYLLGTCVVAQDITDLSPGKLKKLGFTADRSNDPYQAIDLYKQYLKLVNEDAVINYRIAENYRTAKNYKKAAENYSIAYQLKPEKFPKALYYQALMEQSMGSYEKALELFTLFTDEYRDKNDAFEMRKLAESAMEGCQLALKDSLRKNALIKHLDKSINKAHIESSPLLYKGKLLYTSLPLEQMEYFPKDSETFPQRQFYIAKKDDNGWKAIGAWEDIDFPENANISSGAFSLDGNRFYFSVCNTQADGKNSCKLWQAHRNGKDWSKPRELSDNINHDYFTSTQPAVGIDYKGREVLYFVSDRTDGRGGLDIWYSRYRERNGEFDEARNCGSKVNSRGNEYTPFIHPLNNSLYFSSDGHPGYGGLDVFKSTGERGKWEEPMNIGSPINSAVDELYFILNEDGSGGMFASNRKESVPLKNQNCCDDLYSFEYPDHIRIKLNVEVVDENTGKVLEDVKVQLYKTLKGSEEEILLREVIVENGKTNFSLEAGEEYVIKAKENDYLMSEVPVFTDQIRSSEEVYTTVKLKKIPFTAMIIENIYYEFDSAELTEDAKNTIDTTIYPIMLNNPEIVAEISSHTDSKGTEGYNKHLSQKRAESVVNYLRGRGIDKNRMIAKGYGESMPIAKNKNEDGSDNMEGRAKNRRTEFKVVDVMEVSEEE